MAKKNDTSIARAGFAPGVDAKRSYKAFTAPPSHIRADHANNYARAAIYSLAEQLPELAGHPAIESASICFTRAEVLARADSFLADGQRQSIKVWRSGTHVPYVAEGYLRHIAALYLEVTGRLGDAPDMAGRLRCDAEEQPKSPEAQIASAFGNYAENAERKDTTPIDNAWLCKRLLAMQVSRDDVAARLGLSKRSIDRSLSLLALPIDTQLSIHEGRLTVAQALAAASAAGKGSAKGPRTGVKHSQIRQALAHTERRPLPKVGLSAGDAATLVGLIAGTLELSEGEMSNHVAEWYQALTPTREEIQAFAPTKGGKKTKPPKCGEPKILTGVG